MTAGELVVDHLLYATPDVGRTMDDVEQLFGVRPVEGGRHPAWGTRNALLSLGPRTYLEIFGLDEQALEPPLPRPFGLDKLERARLATWIAPHADLNALVRAAAVHHIDLGSVDERSRETPDGTILRWRMTDPRKARADGVLPFFIDWGDTPHPGTTAPRAGSLLALRAEHPQAAEVEAQLAHLELALPVTQADAPLLVATIATPRGVIELR